MFVKLVSTSLPEETPRCPSCGSTDHLWDDNAWEGCNRCGYRGNFGGIVHNGSTEEARRFDEKQRAEAEKAGT